MSIEIAERLEEPVDKEQFLAGETDPWWFVERDIDFRIEELRKTLGGYFGWTDPTWYTERAKLEDLWIFIEQQGPRLNLELDQADDVEKRKLWLDSLVALKAPAEAPSAAPSAGGAVTNDGPAVTESPAPPAEPARRSIFAKKAAADPEGSSTDTATSETRTGAATAEAAQEQIDEAVKAVMSDLSSGGMASLADELGVSEEQLQSVVNDPDFERIVAEEAAKLAPGGS